MIMVPVPYPHSVFTWLNDRVFDGNRSGAKCKRSRSRGGIQLVGVKSRLRSKPRLTGEQTAQTCAMAFREKAGPGQVDFDLPVLKFPFPSWREGVQSGPELGQAIDAVTGTRRWGAVFRFNEPELCGCRQHDRSAVARRFVSLSAHPQTMQQDSQLSCGCDHGSFLPILAATLRQFQTPAPQIAVRSKRSQNVVRSLHQQRS